MLEAIRERAQGWIAKVILALLIIPFALWGIDSYFTGGGREAPAAEINDGKISQREFVRALQEQQEALGAKVEDKALRQAVMDKLVNARLLSQVATKSGFAVRDPQIQAVLGGVEIFQENGKFSQARLDVFLRNRNMSQEELLAMVGQDLLLKQVQIGYGEGALASRVAADQLTTLLSQQREVNEAFFDTRNYLANVKVDEKAVEETYRANQKDYATPEQVRVQYLVLSQTQLQEAIQVGDDQARKYYEANLGRYQEPEQRKAAHILIKLDAGADPKVKAAAKAKAEQVLAEVRKTPARFAELAKQHSQDPASGAQGGSLGAFSRDMMVKPFADAAWSMKPGDISDLVESQFGYHIIRLDGVVPGARMGFEVVKADIVKDLKAQEAQKRFAEAADRFGNLVYEQPDSLEPAAKEFGLKIQDSPWIGKGAREAGLLANARLQDTLFSEDALKKRHNSEAVEVAPNTLVAARVVDHRPAGVRPLADVANEIRARLSRDAAQKQAIEAGKQALAAAQAGRAPASMSAPMTLSRMQPLTLPPASVKAIFRADAGKLPSFIGVESGDGYRLYRINRVVAGQAAPEMAKRIRSDMRQLVAQEEMRAYLENAKAKSKIKIAPSALEPKAE